MKPYAVSPLTKDLVVRFSGKKVALPAEVQEKIDAYWDGLIRAGKSYTRGEVFTVTRKEAFDYRLEVLVERTDYAHYLYCQNVGGLGDLGVRIVHTAALIETNDGKIVFGKMGGHTSRAGLYQLCGGGIDDGDLRGDVFDFGHSIAKELREELGIDVADRGRVTGFGPAYFKEGGPTDKMTAVYRVVLNETGTQFLKRYGAFAKDLLERGETPEFGEIVVLGKDNQTLLGFLDRKDATFDECIRPLFEYLTEGLE
jgi:8-oxo-dGTP pyrophosphatase MutT (NUDIX family)